MMTSSNKYWAFVASLSHTLALADQLADEGDEIAAEALKTHLKPCSAFVRDASRDLLLSEQTRMAGAMEVLGRLQPK
jgi:hypothetical protein